MRARRAVAFVAALAISLLAGRVSARAAFEAVELPIEAEDVSLVPTHPALGERGYIGFLAQNGDGDACEVGWVRVVGLAVTEVYRQECGREDGFYNLLPGPVRDTADGGETVMLVAVTPDGVTRVAPGPATRLVTAHTLVAVAPDLKFPGPLLWQDPATPEGALRIVVPELDAVSIWQREPGDDAFRRVERFPIAVRARFDARLGRDTVHPDFHLLAHLRMPKFALGTASAEHGRGMVVGLENRLTLVHPDGAGELTSVEHDLDLFRHDANGLSVVRGSRLGDFDGDGSLDAMVVAARGGLTNLESRAELYFGPLETKLSEPPAIRYRLTDAAAGTELVDVDGDGAAELYRPTIEISIGAVVRILLFKEVRIEYLFAELVPGDPDRPAWFCTVPRTFTVNLGGVAKHPGPLFDLRGDFDGDGVTDVVTGTPEDGYDILRGVRGESGWCVSDDSVAVELESLDTLSVVRLDADARWDLVAWRRRGEGRSGLVALFSR